MWYSLRRADGSSDPVSSGTLVLADGRAHALDAQDLNIEPTGPLDQSAIQRTVPAAMATHLGYDGIG